MPNSSVKPAYLDKHEGVVLVCGHAFCFREDIVQARIFYPEAPVIAVNGAAGEIRAFALFTQHPIKLPGWIKMQEDRFGLDFTTHAAGKHHIATKLGHKAVNGVEHWWEGVAGGGTSVWGARKMAHFMGFDKVVLVGAPLEVGGYGDGKFSKLMQRPEVIEGYREYIKNDTAWHEGVVSTSGWTEEFFGGVAS